MSIPRRGKENQQDYNERNTPAGNRGTSREDNISDEPVDEPVVDEEDLEENDLEDEDLDDIEWEETDEDEEEDDNLNSRRGSSGSEEKDITA